MPRKRDGERWMALLVILMAVYIYYPVREFGYVWDDMMLIVEDHRLQSGILSWEALSRPVLEGTSYFRPLVFLTYFLELKLFGLNAGVSHVVNLIILLINVALAYFLSREVLDKMGLGHLALLVAALYGFHPVLVEPVAWIAGRFDLLASTFVFSSLLIFLRRKSIRWPSDIAITVLTTFGLLCKEMAVTAPGLMFILYLAREQEKKIVETTFHFFRSHKRLIGMLVVAGMAYFFLRVISVGQVYHFEAAAAAQEKDYALLPLYTLTFYLHQILLPFFEITPQHDIGLELEKPYQGWPVYIGILISIVMLVYAIIKNRSIGWLGAASLLSLIPVMNLIPMTIGGNIGHERFLTLPLLFFLMFFVCGSAKVLTAFPARRHIKYVCAFLFASAFIAGSIFTSISVLPIWRSNYTLWGGMYQKTPDLEYVSAAYFLTLLNDRRFDEFEVAYKKLLANDGELRPIHLVYYSTYLLEKRDPLALKAIEAAIRSSEEQMVRVRKGQQGEVSNNMLYSLYIDKAFALAILEGDVASALDASLKADKWRGKTSPINYEALWQRLAYYAILKDAEGVKNLYARVKSMPSWGGKNMAHVFLDVVYQNCRGFGLMGGNACEKTALDALQEVMAISR